MSETELLRAFFQAYEAVQALPKQKGPPGPEKRAALELLERTAAAVRAWKPDAFQEAYRHGADQLDKVAQEYRALAVQVQAITPKDTRTLNPLAHEQTK